MSVTRIICPGGCGLPIAFCKCKRELKSLIEFNKERMCAYTTASDNKPVKNGIACPDCGDELMDVEPNIILCSNPPQKKIRCVNCDYKGHRIC